jgi:hypothetical protein
MSGPSTTAIGAARNEHSAKLDHLISSHIKLEDINEDYVTSRFEKILSIAMSRSAPAITAPSLRKARCRCNLGDHRQGHVELQPLARRRLG